MKPFNLEEAKAGKPLVTSLGQVARFIAYVPDAHHNDRVVIMIDGLVWTSDERGGHSPPYRDPNDMGSTEYQGWTLGMASEKIVRYTTPYALFNGSGNWPLNSLDKLKDLGHRSADNVASCSDCNPPSLAALQPTLRIEWEE